MVVSPCLIQWKDCSIENPEIFFYYCMCQVIFYKESSCAWGRNSNESFTLDDVLCMIMNSSSPCIYTKHS